MDHQISAAFVDEVVNAATRAMYAQPVDRVHALAGAASLSATRGYSVRGGNSLIFEHLLNKSGASVRMGLAGEVTGLMKMRQSSSDTNGSIPCQWWVGTRDGHGEVYDAVIIATPWHHTGITLLGSHKTVPTYETQRVHIALMVTDQASFNASYFGRHNKHDTVPHTILTTSMDEGRGPEVRGRDSPQFLSAAYVRHMRQVRVQGQEWPHLYVVKVVSETELSDEQLAGFWGNASAVLWKRRQSWDAYPKLTATDKLGDFEVDAQLFNANALERWVSSMESSMIGAKNVVAVLLQRWLGAAFVLGSQCVWPESEETRHWAGWGCRSI